MRTAPKTIDVMSVKSTVLSSILITRKDKQFEIDVIHHLAFLLFNKWNVYYRSQCKRKNDATAITTIATHRKKKIVKASGTIF